MTDKFNAALPGARLHAAKAGLKAAQAAYVDAVVHEIALAVRREQPSARSIVFDLRLNGATQQLWPLAVLDREGAALTDDPVGCVVSGGALELAAELQPYVSAEEDITIDLDTGEMTLGAWPAPSRDGSWAI